MKRPSSPTKRESSHCTTTLCPWRSSCVRAQGVVNPKPFLAELVGKPVVVKLKWGMEYKGEGMVTGWGACAAIAITHPTSPHALAP